MLIGLLILILCFLIGYFIQKKLAFFVPSYSQPFFSISIGIILFTAIAYLTCSIVGFSRGIVLANIEVAVFVILYILLFRPSFNLSNYLSSLRHERFLICLLIFIGTILIILFHTHIIRNINGDLYTGESTYGDLPFHLATISEMAYGNQFPPNNPLVVNHPLVYPYLINFFSAILVYVGMSLRDSILIPGIILSVALVGLVYDFSFSLTKSRAKSFLASLLFFFNGGMGFYYFLKDHYFNITSIINSLFNPTQMKEYSHLFDQNIQWVNFLSRMIVPERSILFGIPAGIIILRILFFRDTEKPINKVEIILVSLLLSLMPLLHTHTAIVFTIILPILALTTLKRNQWGSRIKTYLAIVSLSALLVIPHLHLFLNHVGSSNNFFKVHLGWMTASSESFVGFWFKNSYLWIPLTIVALCIPKLLNTQTKILVFCGFVLFAIMNVVLFSPYDWDNIKFLFWIGLFFSIAISSLLIYFLKYKNIFLRGIVLLIILTFFSSALLSLDREVNLKYVLFSKDAVSLASFIKTNAPKDSRFLTYKVHNSPASNLAGRQIIMGYPGSLWVHGINYQQVDNDVTEMFSGTENTTKLMNNYNIGYVVLESNNPSDLLINNDFFEKYKLEYRNPNYFLYKVL